MTYLLFLFFVGVYAIGFFGGYGLAAWCENHADQDLSANRERGY